MTREAHISAIRRSLPAVVPPSLVQPAEIVPLVGDASSRSYYRVRVPHTASSHLFPASVVVMAYPDEIAPGKELPFLNVHRYLRLAGIPVPDVLHHKPESRLLFLEDAGDTMLEDAVKKHGTTACLPMYEQCIEVLVRIQADGTRTLDGSAIPARLAFDMAKFGEEIDFFFEQAVRKYGGIRLSGSEERAIEDLFIPFLERTVSLPRVLTHRDYHSRNVMVLADTPAKPEKPGLRVLDYQDARMGSVFYDLASLLRDSYVTLAEEEEDHLKYVWRHLAHKELLRAAGDPGAFTELLDAAALQRNVKAIGTFGNQAHTRGKKLYLHFIPPTVARLRSNFSRNPAMRPLSEKLLPLLEALAEKAMSETPSPEGTNS